MVDIGTSGGHKYSYCIYDNYKIAFEQRLDWVLKSYGNGIPQFNLREGVEYHKAQ